MIRFIDMFAGVGGFTVGGKQSGMRPVWAGNHWAEARAAYELNHGLQPAEENLLCYNYAALPKHDLGLASPACQGFTNARGDDLPHHDACRTTPFAVVEYLRLCRPKLGCVVEEVTEFLHNALFPAWKLACEALGYAVAVHIIDAADHGVPQHRVRALLLLTRSRKPLHLKLPNRPHVAATHILTDEANGIWTPVADKCAATRARIAAGRKRWGHRRFLMVYYGTNRAGRSLARPLGTLTTRDRFALVEGRYMRFLTVNEVRAGMGFPADYQLPANKKLAKHLLGNAVCPPVVTDFLTELRRAA